MLRLAEFDLRNKRGDLLVLGRGHARLVCWPRRSSWSATTACASCPRARAAAARLRRREREARTARTPSRSWSRPTHPPPSSSPRTCARSSHSSSGSTTQPEIGGSTGLVDFVKLLNRAFHENDPDATSRCPRRERLTGQLLFLGASDELEGYVDARYQLTNIQVRSTVFDTELVIALVKRIEERHGAAPAAAARPGDRQLDPDGPGRRQPDLGPGAEHHRRARA